MKNIIILTTLISLLSQSQALHSFSSLSKLTPSQLDKDNRIQIQDTLSPGITNLNSHSYIIKQIHKDKRQAYLLIRQKNKLVQNILKTNHLVPNEQSIVKSQIKPEYLSHQRKWSFTTIFAIFGTEGQLQKCFRIFNRLKIHRLKTVPSIAYLTQKRMVIQVFNSAKNKLNKALTSHFKDFQIKEVEDIEIKGIEMSNSDMFERHLQEEQNSSQEKVISNKDIEMMNEEVPYESISIKIIFKVGRVDHQENSSEEQEEGNEFHEQFDEDQSDYSHNSL